MPLIIPGNSQASTGYTIDQSIRFNDDDSPSLDKTYSGAGSRTTFTFSCWFKIGNTSTPFPFFNGGTGTSDTGWTGVGLSSSSIYVQGYNTNWKITTRKLRDHSAWYHLVFVWDTTNTIASERIRIYINGQRETDFSTDNNPSASAQAGIGQAQKHSIGYQSRSVGYSYADCYMAEIHYLDGYAYDSSFFGEFNSSGIWIPKEYTGSYGTNGFKIDGRDASDLGDDESGNGNDFTTSGLAAHDQVFDTPTNNFNTINPLNPLSDGTLSQGNLKNVLSGNDQFYTTQELGIKSYCEVRVDALSNYGGTLGLGTFGGDDDDNSLVFQTNYSSGYIYLNGGNASANIGGTVSAGDIVMMAYDPTTRKWWVGVNGTWRNSGDPAGGTGQVYQHSTTDFGEGIGAIVWGGWKGSANGLTVTWNFGQEGTFGGQETAGGNSDSNGIGNFKYSVPSGFLANCTKNLGS